jgi:hypothetical protein
MKKIVVLFMALLLPLSALKMRADEEDAVIKIPLSYDKGADLRRDSSPDLITSIYYGMLSSIQTIISSDLGDIDVMVYNISTGESWFDTFDSSLEMQTFLPISGDVGLYEIIYMTESGEIYSGSFIID